MTSQTPRFDQEPSGRVVLVTGAGGGIGRVLCERFLHAGDTVLALDFNAESLSALQAALPTPRLVTVLADLTQADDVLQAVARATQQVGDVDLLVSNAGAVSGNTLKTTSVAAWQQDVDINLNGPFYAVEAVRQQMMARRRGGIVIIGSVNSMSALGHPAYSAAKAGLVSYTRTLATELGAYGIRANIVLPGTVKTPIWEARARKDPQIFERLKKWYPLGDFATPNDVADAVLFLASPQARMITGVALPVDGGMLAGNRLMLAELTVEST